MSESPFLLISNENKRFGDLEKGQENKPILKLSRKKKRSKQRQPTAELTTLASEAGHRSPRVGEARSSLIRQGAH